MNDVRTRKAQLLAELRQIDAELARADAGEWTGPSDEEWLAEARTSRQLLTITDLSGRIRFTNYADPGDPDHVGRNILEFIPEEDHPVVGRAMERAAETGQPQHYDIRAQGPTEELSTYSNWVVRLSSRVSADSLAFITTDVTHVERVERELEISRDTLESLVQNAPDFILIVDREHTVTFMNRSSMGVAKEDVLGRPILNFVPAEEQAKVIGAIEHVFETGGHTSYETAFDAQGRRTYWNTRLGPVLLGGKVEQVTLITHEVTQRVESLAERERIAEQLHQAQKMEVVGQLTGGIAHDFNNLLMALMGSLELIVAGEPAGAETAELAGQALEVVHQASTLTERLLAFSRQQLLHPCVLDLDELLGGMESLLQRTLGKTLEVRLESDDGLGRCVADPTRLQNAILNLAINARDAMENQGRLSITCSNVKLDRTGALANGNVEPGEYVRISVTDTGTGMSPEVLERACEPFFTTKEVGHGSGLGLSMVYGFAKQSSGHFVIDTVVGEGTSAHILLPRADGELPAEAPQDTEVGTPRGDGELILVVEDEPVVRKMSIRLLEKLGYTTVWAERADRALEILTERPEIALLFTDVVLPGGVNGVELARRARDSRPGLDVLFASGYARPELAQGEPPGEGARWLSKPFSLQSLARAVRDTLDGSSARR